MNRLRNLLTKSQLSNQAKHLYLWMATGRGKKVALIIVLAVTVLAGIQIPKLSFNYNMENFFDQHDEDVKVYERFKKLFGNENNGLIIGVTNNHGIFDQSFLFKIDSLTRLLEILPETDKVLSPTSASDYVYAPLVGSVKVPILHIENPEKYKFDGKRIYADQSYARSLFSDDKKSIAIVLSFSKEMDDAESKVLLSRLDQMLSGFDFDDSNIAGRIQTQHYYITEMKSEMALFSAMALSLFILTLFAIFRDWKFVAISFGVVFIAQIWLFGLVALLNIPMDLMMILLPALIFILGTSISIHAITQFRREYVPKIHKTSAISKAMLGTSIPNFLNSLTTAIGFLSLVFIPVLPVQQFGALAAVGIMITFIIGIILIPIALQIVPLGLAPNDLKRINSSSFNGFVISLVSNKKSIVLFAFSLFVLSGLYYATKVKVNNYFLDDLKASSSLGSSLKYFERNFSGIKPIEILIHAGEGQDAKLLDFESIKEIERVETFIKQNFQTGFILSPVMIVKSINKALHGGSQSFYAIPKSETQYKKILKAAEKQKVWNLYSSILSRDNNYARISFRTLDIGSNAAMEKEELLNRYINKHTSNLDFEFTGVSHLLDNTNEKITGNLMKGILLAIFTATLVIWIFTKSSRIALISAIINFIPLIFAAGIMGFFNIPLKVSTSLIFTIVYGITVDDTIHFLNAYIRFVKQTKNVSTAIKMAVKKLLKPMISTSLVLFSGFMIFSLSDFQSIQMLGLLVGASLLFGLITDLLLLPILIRLLFIRKEGIETSLALSNI